MKKVLIRKSLLVVALIGLGFGFSGCGKSLDGKYVANRGAASVEFRSGKAIIANAANTETDDYIVEGDKITIQSAGAGGEIVMTRTSDGNLLSSGVVFFKH